MSHQCKRKAVSGVARASLRRNSSISMDWSSEEDPYLTCVRQKSKNKNTRALQHPHITPRLNATLNAQKEVAYLGQVEVNFAVRAARELPDHVLVGEKPKHEVKHGELLLRLAELLIFHVV